MMDLRPIGRTNVSARGIPCGSPRSKPVAGAITTSLAPVNECVRCRVGESLRADRQYETQ
jgi:hypothetical protein